MLSLVLAQTVFLLLLVGVAHRFRSRLGFEPLMALLVTVIVVVQWLSDVGSMVVADSLPFFIASIVFFPSVLVGLFFIFVFDGPMHTRKLFFGLVIGEVLYALAVLFLWLLGLMPDYLHLDMSWFQNHTFSTIAVIADFYFVTFVWSVMSKKESLLFLKIAAVFFAVSCLDTTIFVFGAFWNNPAMWSILKADLITRAILSAVVVPVAYVYVLLERKRTGFHLETRYPWSILISEQETQLKLKQAKEKITELERTQQQLKEMVTVVNQSHSAVIVFSKLCEITWVNHGFLKLTGYAESEIIGKRREQVFDLLKVSQEEVSAFKQGIEQLNPFSVELEIKSKEGRSIWIHTDITPVFDNNEVIKFIEVDSDVTQMKLTAQKLEETNKQLSRMNSLMVDRELKMVELKQQLHPVKGST